MKISIIVPVYNTEKYLDRCLSSILNQKLYEIEIIIINDCSTDKSLKIIKKYMNLDKRIILIDKKKNEGLSEARNSGIKIAKGKYILHIDSDDWIEEEYFKDMYDYAEKSKADIVISDFYKDYNNKIIYRKDQNTNIEIDKTIAIEKIFLGGGYPCVWNKLIKKDLYEIYGIKHPKGIGLGEDLAVTPKLIYYSKKVVKLNHAYYHYIQNDLSITKIKNENKLYEIFKVLKMNEEFFKDKDEIKLFIDLLKINNLSSWLFNTKYNFNNKEYVKILNEYLKLIKKIKIKEIKNIKIKIVSIIFKILKSEKMFVFLWKISNLKNMLIKNKN